jgi:hypothetical protein
MLNSGFMASSTSCLNPSATISSPKTHAMDPVCDQVTRVLDAWNSGRHVQRATGRCGCRRSYRPRQEEAVIPSHKGPRAPVRLTELSQSLTTSARLRDCCRGSQRAWAHPGRILAGEVELGWSCGRGRTACVNCVQIAGRQTHNVIAATG